MTIRQQGGIFGRNPTFNNVGVEGDLSASGNVSGTLIGVGTPNPTEEVHILATLPTIQLEDSNNNYKARVYSNNGDVIIGSDVGNGNAGSAIRFEIDNSEVGRFTDAGNLKFSVAGNGIDFSATSGTGTSELFDDYEEGTWTPVVADASSGGNTGSASVAVGSYTKVGRLIHITVELSNINTSGLTSGNRFFIQGLPYAASDEAGSPNYTGVAYTNDFSFTNPIVFVLGDNSAAIGALENVSGGSHSTVKVSQLASGTADLEMSFTYQSAS